MRYTNQQLFYFTGVCVLYQFPRRRESGEGYMAQIYVHAYSCLILSMPVFRVLYCIGLRHSEIINDWNLYYVTESNRRCCGNSIIDFKKFQIRKVVEYGSFTPAVNRAPPWTPLAEHPSRKLLTLPLYKFRGSATVPGTDVGWVCFYGYMVVFGWV